MHELSVAQSIVDDVVDRLGDTRVTKVTMEIGRLSGIVVPAIEFCFDLATEGTPLAGAELVVHPIPGRAHCRPCGTGFRTSDPILLCPTCASSDVEVLTGRRCASSRWR
ncbi:hydrogenase maturation nickel metallochaperone HypA [Kibdelosporangium lantanae]